MVSNHEHLNIMRYENGDVEVFYEDWYGGDDSSWLLNHDVAGSITRLYTPHTDVESSLTAEQFVAELKDLAGWLAERGEADDD